MSINRPQVHVLRLREQDEGAEVCLEIEIDHRTYAITATSSGWEERIRLETWLPGGSPRVLLDGEAV